MVLHSVTYFSQDNTSNYILYTRYYTYLYLLYNQLNPVTFSLLFYNIQLHVHSIYMMSSYLIYTGYPSYILFTIYLHPITFSVQRITIMFSVQGIKSSNILFTRFYIQLPTEKAHEFHGELQLNTAEPAPVVTPEPETLKERLDPRVRQKIRELVAAGECNVYAVRKQLR